MSLIKTRFGATSTAEEVVADHDLSGIRAVVTGGASGIGIETARALALKGAEVTLAVRKVAAGKQVAADIAAETGNQAIHVGQLDTTDRASIDRFIAGWEGPLHLLINNAGIMAHPLARTPEGWESQFATNHLGHFVLSSGLRDPLAQGAQDRGGARIVVVSSSAHSMAPVDFDDLHFERRDYEPWAAYGQSKSANILFAVEAYRRWAADGIIVNALHPGLIATHLTEHMSEEFHEGLREMERNGLVTMKTPQQGAATSLVAAVAPEFANSGGHYLCDGNEAETMDDDIPYGPDKLGVRRWALDPASARRLWDVSSRLTGL
jgi:NAD(P)-dependent dehydrogenase (short-subunit alcohol dehydrogenase family)